MDVYIRIYIKSLNEERKIQSNVFCSTPTPLSNSRKRITARLNCMYLLRVESCKRRFRASTLINIRRIRAAAAAAAALLLLGSVLQMTLSFGRLQIPRIQLVTGRGMRASAAHNKPRRCVYLILYQLARASRNLLVLGRISRGVGGGRVFALSTYQAIIATRFEEKRSTAVNIISR